MLILFCDLARNTGFAIGEAKAKPTSWSVALGAPGSDVGLQCGALARELQNVIAKHGIPDIVGIEKWMNPRGQPAHD